MLVLFVNIVYFPALLGYSYFNYPLGLTHLDHLSYPVKSPENWVKPEEIRLNWLYLIQKSVVGSISTTILSNNIESHLYRMNLSLQLLIELYRVVSSHFEVMVIEANLTRLKHIEVMPLTKIKPEKTT